MEMKVVKGGNEQPAEPKDPAAEFMAALDAMKEVFIIEVINTGGLKGYVGRQDGKLVITTFITPLVTKFSNYPAAKEYSNSIAGAKKNVLGKSRIKRIIEKQSMQATTTPDEPMPIEKAECDIYHIIVKNKDDDMLVGYLSLNKAGDEFSVIKDTNGASFWDKTEAADLFIHQFSKTYLGPHPNLKLEKVKYN